MAFSEIRNNLGSLRLLREREENIFDCVAIAGDFGNDAFWEIIEIAKSFDCPVVFVCGNWNSEIEYDQNVGSHCHLFHLNVLDVEGFSFAGYSGVHAHWGRIPIAKIRYAECEQRQFVFRKNIFRFFTSGQNALRRKVPENKNSAKKLKQRSESKRGRAWFEDAKKTHKSILIENREHAFAAI